jgi:hypothetical protein
VVDGGVRIVDLDKEALAAWWLRHLGVEFDRQRKLLGRICAFCVWDARYVDGDLNTERGKFDFVFLDPDFYMKTPKTVTIPTALFGGRMKEE